jgi:hypothetical protein
MLSLPLVMARNLSRSFWRLIRLFCPERLTTWGPAGTTVPRCTQSSRSLNFKALDVEGTPTLCGCVAIRQLFVLSV